jgi:hypothetical protein
LHCSTHFINNPFQNKLRPFSGFNNEENLAQIGSGDRFGLDIAWEDIDMRPIATRRRADRQRVLLALK